MRVLLSAYMCSPDRGSEAGVSWNWARSLAEHHEVCVLTNPLYRPEVTEWTSRNSTDALSFCWVEVPRFMYPWHLPRGKTLLYFLHWRVHYVQWLKCALKEAQRQHHSEPFDVVHHVSYIQFFPPPRYFELPVPFVLGPVGGGMTAPPAFREYFGRSWWLEAARSRRVELSRWMPSVHRSLRQTDVCLAANRETEDLLRTIGARDVRRFLDGGLPPEFASSEMPRGPENRIPTLLWASRSLQPRKGLAMLLDAARRAMDSEWKLIVVGDGPLRSFYEQMARDYGISDRVKFVGQVAWDEMKGLFETSDVFVFTSLRDTFGTVVLEAMAHGKPILTLDHQGVGTFLPTAASIKVPVESATQTVAGLADGIRRLSENHEFRVGMGKAAWDFARGQTWEKRAREMTEIYDEVRERAARR